MSESLEPTILHTISGAAPGFLGAVVAAVYLQRPVNRLEGLISIVSGALTAVFITPVVVSFFAPGNQHATAGFGYGIGMATVVLLPPIMRRTKELIERIVPPSVTLEDKEKE